MKKLCLTVGAGLIVFLMLGDQSIEIPVYKLSGLMQPWFDQFESTSHRIRDDRSKAAFIARFPEPKR